MFSVLLAKVKKLNLKYVIKTFTLIWGLVLIVIMTITNLGLKQEFDFLEWIGNSMILFGIMVFGLLMGESIGDDKQREKGLFQDALKDYNDKRQEIDKDINYFNQYYQWLVPQELRDKKINFLIENGMPSLKARMIVKYCDSNNYVELCNHPLEIKNDKGEKVAVIRQLTEEEKLPVEMVFTNQIKLDLYNANYYLSAFGIGKTKSILEIGKQLDKDIKFNKRSNRAMKIFISLAVSLGLGILTVKEFMSGDDGQAWVNLVSRIAALFTSIVSGWLSSVIDVKLKAEKLINKKNILTMFQNALATKQFIPKSEDELAEEELQAYKKEQEKVIVNIVDPTPMLEDKTIYAK